MDVVLGPTNGQSRDSILTSYTSQVSVKILFNIFTNHRPTLSSRKNHMDQARYMTVRHAFHFPSADDWSPRTHVLGNFQPSLAGLHRAYQLYPGLASWAILSRPSRDYVVRINFTWDWRPGYFQPSLRGLFLFARI